MRLQGKSARRRGEEAIDIIDVHTDDQKVSELELTKNISQVASCSFTHHLASMILLIRLYDRTISCSFALRNMLLSSSFWNVFIG